MTEEDQLLVAKAALAGVRFWRTTDEAGQPGCWTCNLNDPGGLTKVEKYTIGRAASVALKWLGHMSKTEFQDYNDRTSCAGPQDCDLSLAMTLAGDLPDAASATAAPCADPELLPR